MGEYDNLIKAIGALQYTSKYMANIVPLAFQAWKEMVFEKRANRLHDMLSSPSSHHSENVIFHFAGGQRNPGGDPTSERLVVKHADQDDEDDGLLEADDDYEEYFFKDQGEDEQYVRLVGQHQIEPGSFQQQHQSDEFSGGYNENDNQNLS